MDLIVPNANNFLPPHVGSATRESGNAMGLHAISNLDASFSGQQPRARVA